MTCEIFIDIETIPLTSPEIEAEVRATIKPPANYSKPETIEKWLAENAEAKAQEIIHARGLKAETGRIICIGVSDVDADLSVLSGENEADILAHFFRAVEIKAALDLPSVGEVIPNDIYLIAHNAEFDIGYIRRRAWVNKIRIPHWFPKPDARAPRDYGCTMQRWAGHKDRISLDNLCAALGVQSPKGDIDGSKVWQAYKDGRVSEIATYCGRDVMATLDCWERLR